MILFKVIIIVTVIIMKTSLWKSYDIKIMGQIRANITHLIIRSFYHQIDCEWLHDILNRMIAWHTETTLKSPSGPEWTCCHQLIWSIKRKPLLGIQKLFNLIWSGKHNKHITRDFSSVICISKPTRRVLLYSTVHRALKNKKASL